MFAFRESSYLACFLLILIVFWHLFVRHYVLMKVQPDDASPAVNFRKGIIYSSLLMAFKDGSRHAHLQPLLLFIFNLILAAVLVFYTDNVEG